MTEPAARPARDLRSELIAAAVAMLTHSQMITVPSLRSIARACDVAPSAVYWHFPSEADLREAVLDAEYTDMVNAVEAATANLTPGPAAVIKGAQAYVEWGITHPGAYQLLFESDDPVPQTRAENGLRLQRHIIELFGVADPARGLDLGLTVWAVQHGIVSIRNHKKDAPWRSTPEELVAEVIGSMLAALTA